MDIGSAFTYTFDDEDWLKKIAIGGGAILLSIIIVPIFLVMGYMVQTIKNVRDGHEKPLPEWDNIGDLFMKGLMVFVIALAYNIVPIIIMLCPTFLIAAVASSVDPDVGDVLLIASNCFMCLGVIILLAINLVLPAGIIRYAEYDTLGSAFQFGPIFSFITNNIGDYIIAILLSWVASFIAGFGIILCFVGVYFTHFWGVLVTANLYGQLARKASE